MTPERPSLVPKPALPASQPAAPTVNAQALDAQSALLPYGLACFAATLPFYVWAGSHAANAQWMTGSFVIFAIAWGAFYGIVNWLKQPAARDLARRGRVQILGGLLWAGAIAQVAAFADGAGPARATLLMASLAAAAVCVVFTAPWLPSLLIVAPAALAGPLIAMFSRPETKELARLCWGGVALTLALALLVNRILREQFALAAEREILMAERAEQAQAARRLARSKSDLVATLSNEIRDGLTGVAHVLAAAAGRGGRAAPSREQLGAALTAANDLLAVLNTTLDAETAEAGRLTVEPRPVDIVGLAGDLVLLNRATAAAKGLEIALHVEPALADPAGGAAIADPGRVRQVLAGLISNAVTFTVRGRVEVRVGLVGQDRVTIAVADTGPGLSDEELAVAFEPFQRVARTAAGTSGAGLGLTLAKRLARLMAGELRAQSAPGVGSCFTLELPYDAEASVEAAERPPAEGEPRRLRVLIAAGEALTGAMLRAQLEQLGHQVVQAADGHRALELAKVCDLDLMMVDARLLAADGRGAIEALRRLDGAAGRIPVIALIGGEADALPEGPRPDALLRKPMSMPTVARALAEAMAARSAANDRAA
jgi:signal transduction histidine kinase/CheY-like chemotaxis protein